MSFNPYAPPTSPEQAYYGHQEVYDHALAGLGARFVAKLLDGLLELALIIPGAIWLYMTIIERSERSYAYSSSYGGDPSDEILAAMIGPGLVMVVPVLALTIYQWI